MSRWSAIYPYRFLLRLFQGHAAANVMPVVASNRTGTEDILTFYGSAFIADPTGGLVQQANKTDDNVVLVHEFDLEQVRAFVSVCARACFCSAHARPFAMGKYGAIHHSLGGERRLALKDSPHSCIAQHNFRQRFSCSVLSPDPDPMAACVVGPIP